MGAGVPLAAGLGERQALRAWERLIVQMGRETGTSV